MFATIAVLISFATRSQSAGEGILKTIARHYYKNEKPIVKGRNQLLFVFCDQPANNEEIFETVNALKLPPGQINALRKKVLQDVAPANWRDELEKIMAHEDMAGLRTKVNDCLTLEEYQQKQQRFNLNNQRLMIIYRPLLYNGGKSALAKIVFYRSIEHNSGAVLKLEFENNNWVIKDFLNKWST